jgi:hypothetical protein
MACMPSGIESGSTLVLTSAAHIAAPRNDNAESRPRFRRATSDQRGLIELRLTERWPPRRLPCPVPHRAGDNERPQLGATPEISHPGFVRRGTVNREVSMIRLAVAGPRDLFIVGQGIAGRLGFTSPRQGRQTGTK